MGLITPNSENNQCVKIILILVIVLVLIYYFLFNSSKKKINNVELFENIDTNLIINGDFEAITSNTSTYINKKYEYLNETQGSWNFKSAVISDKSTYWSPIPTSKAIFLQNNASISQDINLSTRYIYTLAFNICARNLNNTTNKNPIDITLTDSIGTIVWRTSDVFSTNSSNWNNKITFDNLSVNKNGIYTLEFYGTNTYGDQTAGIDNISLKILGENIVYIEQEAKIKAVIDANQRMLVEQEAKIKADIDAQMARQRTIAEQEVMLARDKAYSIAIAYAEQESVLAKKKADEIVKAYAEQEAKMAKKEIDKQYLTKIEEVAYQSMGVPSVPRDNTVYVPPANNASIPLSQQEINKIREDTYKTVLPEDTPAGLINLVGNIQSSGGREIMITNSKDVNEMMVDSTFKLKVNIPGMPSYNIGEDYEKVKNRNPNNFYLSVEKLMPNCTILSSTGQCYDVYINDKNKCNLEKTTSVLSTNNYRLVLIPEETALNKDNDIGKNTDFTLIRIADKYYLKNIQTGYMPSLFQSEKTYSIYGDIVNDTNSNVANSLSQIYNRVCTLNANDNLVPSPVITSSNEKTINLSKPGCNFDPDPTIYLTTSNQLTQSSPIFIIPASNNKVIIQLIRYNSYGQPLKSYNLKSCAYDTKNLTGIEKVKSQKYNISQFVNIICFGDPDSEINKNLNFSVEIIKFSDEYLRKTSLYQLY